MFSRSRRGARRHRPFTALAATASMTAALLTLGTAPADAYYTPAYNHDSGVAVARPDWMAQLDPSVRLSQLSLPATHDAGTAAIPDEPITQTQSMSIDSQLQAGIRAMDIRLGAFGTDSNVWCQGGLWFFHGNTCLDLRFGTALNDMASFLAAHPTETLVLRIKHDPKRLWEGGVDPLSDSEFYTDVVNAFAAHPGLLWTGYPDPKPTDATDIDPALKDIRGRIVVLQNFSAGPNQADIGQLWSTLALQDDYSVPTVQDLAGKWWKVRDQFTTANGASTQLYGNFLSAASGAFPYTFASGKITAGTNGDQLWTGWLRTKDGCNGGDRCLPEYPSVNCTTNNPATRICSVNFLGVNELAMNYLNAHPELNRLGLVFADFPGPGLIEAIINTGLRHPPQAPEPTVPAANGAGWFRDDVVVTWNWQAGSVPLDPANCPATTTSTGEGDPLTVTTTCADKRGNRSNATLRIKVDKTAPTLTGAVAPDPVLLGGTATATPQATDPGTAASGVASATCESVDTTTLGVHSVGCAATDVAGNATSVQVPYAVTLAIGDLPRDTKTTFQAAQTVPIRVQMSSVDGVIPAALAAGLAADCSVTATLGDQAPVCARYNPGQNAFQALVKGSRSWPSGMSVPLVIRLTVDGHVIATRTFTMTTK